MTLRRAREKFYTKVTTDLENLSEALGTEVGYYMDARHAGGDLRSNVVEKEVKLIEENEIATDVAVEDHPNNNMLAATINRLPVEILTYIILLANSLVYMPYGEHGHPYLSYSWVCRHWRYILIQSPVFWTLIQPPPKWKLRKKKFFHHQLFRRSGSSTKVDVILTCQHALFDTVLKDLFTKDSSRIRRLQLSNSIPRGLILPGLTHLLSLRSFALIDHRGPLDESSGPEHLSILHLLPILAASNYLDTFHCTLYRNEWASACKDQMASIFSRIKNLSLTLESVETLRPVFNLLHNSPKLQSLQLSLGTDTTATNSFSQIIFPGLEFLSLENLNLMGHIQCPKLSSLNVARIFISHIPDHLIMKDLDFPSIKYLWIRERCQRDMFGYCVLGSKERIDCKAAFTETTDILFGDYPIYEYPRDCFHFYFYSRKMSTSGMQEALSSILPRLTNLIELHLLFPQTYSVCREIIPQLSSLQKITVVSGNGLIGLLHLLSNPSRCPQLTHLSYTTVPLPQNLKEYANDVGRKLKNCLQSRQSGSAISNVALKYIELGNCPPLPKIWLGKLHKLGAVISYTAVNSSIHPNHYDWDSDSGPPF
ncbi:hypothetical protein Clacol_004907 [Clathrus columnatus]|uniref:F-box domain-containing protein n=1 Tax=Clathrus columnatus TaxID=1419009 RepID=A0AAV5A8Q3_9AGAM|nr:hypothetical protein Clacol_004907 [Clathrus columnatus]